MKPPEVLVVDDDPGIVSWLKDTLPEEGLTVYGETSARVALERLRERAFDIVISDVEMPEMRGLDLLRSIHEVRPAQMVLLITAFGSIDLAVESVRAGAVDFLAKPFRAEVLALAVHRAMRERQMRREIVRLRDSVAKARQAHGITTKSPVMRRVLDVAQRAAQSHLPILLSGESGVGKGALARFIHLHSPRRIEPLIHVNCANLPPGLAEAELFGARRGAFTDAKEDRPGLFLQAHEGTLFLDEIAELALDVQPKLLAALEGTTIRPLGSSTDVRADVRVIAASNVPLENALKSNRFRADLYHRLNVVRLEVPPLRERPEDIVLIVDQTLAEIAERTRQAPLGIAANALRWLTAQPWPGNVRELINAVERAAALSDHDVLTFEDFASVNTTPQQFALPDADMSLGELEQRYIRYVLEKTGGHKANAAKILGLDRRTLYRKVAELEKDEK
jgi:DNA-binding NtrC family response regulator